MLYSEYLHGSRTTRLKMASHNIKSPPALSKSSSYETWVKELKIWQLFTDLPLTKQGPAIFLTLEGKAREAVLELDVEKLSSQDGVKNVLEKLDSLYAQDKIQVAYEAYDNFEKFQREDGVSMKDFLIEFERRLSKTKSYGTVMSEDILAYRLLRSANLPESQQQLARATISELTYQSMKTQLLKIFGDKSKVAAESGSCQEVKVEKDALVSSDDTFYGAYKSRPNNFKRNFHQFKSAAQTENQPRGNSARGAAPSDNTNLRRNPLNEKSFQTRCAICDSINHWDSINHNILI